MILDLEPDDELNIQLLFDSVKRVTGSGTRFVPADGDF